MISLDSLLILFLTSWVDAPVITIDRDNVQISESCLVRVADTPLVDADQNGVVHIVGDNITIDFLDPLHGASPGTRPDAYEGTGIVITGTNVTCSGVQVSGYRIGIYAHNADGLKLQDCVLSDNFRQHLNSTTQQEDSSDWLWPHDNDQNEWMTKYGAGIYVEDSDDVIIRNNIVRKGQNGIILDSVNKSEVYDNDSSFLSGWGLALWRCSNNIISCNAFDFCVRGYSHGVYNRGQDSAGILMFEQCRKNIISHNSVTHGGDGFFGFSGKEALGDVDSPEDIEWYRQRGHYGNMLIGNDFSYAAAHGIELTFGFFNSIFSNRIVENAICGIWAGYSKESNIADNKIQGNGDMGYGLERGGINIEHGRKNIIHFNRFSDNACGVHLWWDEDQHLQELPWVKSNGAECDRNIIANNLFKDDELAIHLRDTGGETEIYLNLMKGVNEEIRMEGDCLIKDSRTVPRTFTPPIYSIVGSASPIGKRKHLRGRQNIIMTEWGPYDWESPYLHLSETTTNMHAYRFLGGTKLPPTENIDVEGNVTVSADGTELTVQSDKPGAVTPYRIAVPVGKQMLTRQEVFVDAKWWEIQVFSYKTDPREDVETWRMEAGDDPYTMHDRELNLRYGMGSLDDIKHLPTALPRDHFGTFATTTLSFPQGSWRIRTVSDDGIRVWLNDKVVIEDWTWHAAREHIYDFALKETQDINIRVEHFELDGAAILRLDIEAITD